MKNIYKLLFITLFLLLGFTAKTHFAWAAGCTGTGSCYWVGGTGDWSDTAHWATASGGATTGGLPSATDNCFFNSSSGAGTATISTAVSCNSLDMTGYTGTWAGGLGSLALGGGITLSSTATTTYSSGVNFSSGSGVKTLTSNGVAATFSSMTFADSDSTFRFADNWTFTRSNVVLTLTSGTMDALTNSVTITFADTQAATFTGTFTGSSAFYNLTRNSTAGSGFYSMVLSGDVTVNNTLTLTGFNSTTGRLLVKSGTIGASHTLTAASVAASNVDFEDTVGAGAANWNLASITGLSGDCGGNSGITFTPAVTQYWQTTTTGSKTWSTAGNWFTATNGGGSAGRVPLPQDDIVVDRNSLATGATTITIDMPRAGHSLDFTDETQALTLGAATFTLYGSYMLSPNITDNINQPLTFEGRSGTLANGTSSSMPVSGWKIISAGKANIGTMTFAAWGGIYQLQDALNVAGFISFNTGTFDGNSFNVTTGSFFGLISGNPRTLLLGSSGTPTWTFTGTGNTWNTNGTTMNFNAGTSNIIISNTSATAKNFIGGGFTYNKVTFTGQNIVVTGNNTINTMNLNNATSSTASTVGTFFTGGSTNNIGYLFTNATSTAARAIATSTSATAATLNFTAGVQCVDYMTFSKITASPASTLYAGANSLDNGGNTNITFGNTSCPARPRGTVMQNEKIKIQNGKVLIKPQ